MNIPRLSFCLLCPIFVFSLSAQEYRGTIGGLVTDSSGAPVAGAKVIVTEISTNTRSELVTKDAGEYTAAALLPGDYEINVHIQGFKDYLRKSVHLGAGERVVIDIRLELGDATQTVEVSADVPLINTENASVGQPITTKEVEDLPLNGGTPLTFASLSIGVVATGQPGLIHPFDAGAAAGYSIGGTPAQTNEILINGSPDSTWDGRLAYSPPRDAVLEVRVKAFDTDAGFGHTGGGTINQILKSGTNQLHGTLQELNQPNTLTANNFFNNKNGLGNPVTHFNQYGATIGGPVILPKLYNGKDKLFFEFAWESVRDSQPNTAFLTVPTVAERQGDFSALLKVGPQYQLYDPYTAVQSGTTITRSPYPNNVIPASQLNPISQALLKYFPLPNIAPQRADGYYNFGNTAPTTDTYNNYFGRLDFNVSDRNRLFFDVRRTDYFQSKNDYFGNGSTGSLLTRENWGSMLDDVITINSTNIVDLHFNFTRLNETHPAPSAGFDPTTLGLPSYIAANSRYLQLPYISFSTNSAFQTLGVNSANILPSQSAQFYGTWTSIRGNHTIRTGLDARQYRLNATNYGNSVGNFSFSANTFVRASSSASSTVVLGQDLASFLLGLPTGGSYDENAAGSYYQYYGAGFVQDDWRARPNLTLNLGIRFDHDGPYREKYGRTLNGFDYNAGGPTFATKSNNAIYDTTSHLFSPRFGAAWTPTRLKGKTVIRAGFGMFVSPITISSFSLNGTYSTNPILTQEGFSQSTPYTPTSNNYLTPATTLSNPFPKGIQQPAGSSLGLATYQGQTLTILNPKMSNPYSLRWNIGFQHTLGNSTILEVVYMGNHSVHLPVFETQLNSIPRQYLSTLPYRDQAVISNLTATVPNPYNGIITAGTPSGPTTTTAQLLSRYPQYPTGTGSFSSGILLANKPVGSSYFESLNVHLQKRFNSTGLTIIGNYIHSRLTEQTTFLNDTDPVPEKRISSYDHPNRFVTAITYELPFHGVLKGGWMVNSIYTYQTGQPLIWVNGSTSNPGDYIYSGGPLALNNRNANSLAFDTSQFNTNPQQQLQYHIRTFSTTFDNLRQDGINQLDGSVIKYFKPTESSKLQIRFEAFNLLNHPTFGAPNLTATNSAFGTITSQSNRPRTIQIGARLSF